MKPRPWPGDVVTFRMAHLNKAVFGQTDETTMTVVATRTDLAGRPSCDCLTVHGIMELSSLMLWPVDFPRLPSQDKQ